MSRPFRDTLNQIMNYSNIKEEDFMILLRNQGALTDEMIFAISRYINDLKGINIFYTRNIGTFEVRIRFFDIAIDYVFYNPRKEIAAVVALNLNTLTLFVEFPLLEEKYTIDNNMMDFEKEKKNKLSIARMHVLNDALTRYYTKILYSIYIDQHRRR